MLLHLVALLLVLPMPDGAPGVAPRPDEGKPATRPKEKKICHSVTRSGSRIAETICRTQAEWDSQPSAQDMGEGVDIPGNRATTGRSTNVGGMNKAGGPAR